MNEAVVISPGLFASIQDCGRKGYRAFGVPLGGVMDAHSAGLANLLLGNPSEAAVLEVTQTGTEIQFPKSTSLTLTGADLSARIDGRPVDRNVVLQIGDGGRLAFGKRVLGCRAYCAVHGGFLSPKVLGSRSWYPGITPERLEKDMYLPYRPFQVANPNPTATIRAPDYLFQESVQVFPGPEFHLLKKLQVQKLREVFTVGKNSSRMGIQLHERISGYQDPLLTGPVIPGTVQLTPSGTLIILMRDAQVTGGYPRVLQLSEKGINVMAQKIPGEKLLFDPISNSSGA